MAVWTGCAAHLCVVGRDRRRSYLPTDKTEVKRIGEEKKEMKKTLDFTGQILKLMKLSTNCCRVQELNGLAGVCLETIYLVNMTDFSRFVSRLRNCSASALRLQFALGWQ